MHPVQSQEGWACDQAGQTTLCPQIQGATQGGRVTHLGPSHFPRIDTSAERNQVSLFGRQLLKATYERLDLCLPVESVSENEDQLEKPGPGDSVLINARPPGREELQTFLHLQSRGPTNPTCTV